LAASRSLDILAIGLGMFPGLDLLQWFSTRSLGGRRLFCLSGINFIRALLRCVDGGWGERLWQLYLSFLRVLFYIPVPTAMRMVALTIILAGSTGLTPCVALLLRGCFFSRPIVLT
jgi:hypothetical protein